MNNQNNFRFMHAVQTNDDQHQSAKWQITGNSNDLSTKAAQNTEKNRDLGSRLNAPNQNTNQGSNNGSNNTRPNQNTGPRTVTI